MEVEELWWAIVFLQIIAGFSPSRGPLTAKWGRGLTRMVSWLGLGPASAIGVAPSGRRRAMPEGSRSAAQPRAGHGGAQAEVKRAETTVSEGAQSHEA